MKDEQLMPDDSQESSASEPRRYCGPQGLGEQAASALEQGAGAGSGIGAMEEESILQRWAEESGCLISPHEWEGMKIISKQTSEHEVRYRTDGHRAWKKTWPAFFTIF